MLLIRIKGEGKVARERLAFFPIMPQLEDIIKLEYNQNQQGKDIFYCNRNLIVRTDESGIPSHGTFDNTALNGIRLLCTGGLEAKSSEGPKGTWYYVDS